MLSEKDARLLTTSKYLSNMFEMQKKYVVMQKQ